MKDSPLASAYSSFGRERLADLGKPSAFACRADPFAFAATAKVTLVASAYPASSFSFAEAKAAVPAIVLAMMKA